MALSPFQWVGNQAMSPGQVQEARNIAAALASQRSKPAANGWEGLSQVANALSERAWRDQASEAETAGRERAGSLFADLAINSDPNAIMAALTSPDSAWASPAQTSIASALLNQGLERSDPMYQAQLAQLTAPKQPDYPTSVQEYLYAQSDPEFAAWQAENGGGQTINVGGESANIGTIPPGYAAIEDPTNPSGFRFEAIPNSQAEREAIAASQATGVKAGQRDTVTDTIVNEANNVRKASEGFAATGPGNWLTGGVGFTPAGQVNQSVNSLKAIAAVENVTAMRNASPTGAALGAASDRDLALLQDKAGALNPQSPNFADQVDDYERTLLRIVHGYEAGDKIFYETRQGPVKIGTQSDYDAAPSGTEFIAPDGTTRVKP